MNKSKGVVELKGERVAFLFFLLKRLVFFFFFFKGAHGLGFGHGVLWLIDVPCSGFFFYFYLHLVVESRNPLPAKINICKYRYTHTYTYLYIHIYIYLWRREGAVMRKLKTMTSHRRWYDQSSWAVLGHGEKLIFLFCRSNIGGARASWFPCGQGSGQQLQAGLMLGPGLGF